MYCPPVENQVWSLTKDHPQQAVSIRDQKRKQDSSQHKGVSVDFYRHSSEGHVSCLCWHFKHNVRLCCIHGRDGQDIHRMLLHSPFTRCYWKFPLLQFLCNLWNGAVQQSVSVSSLIDAEQQNKSNKQESEIKRDLFP